MDWDWVGSLGRALETGEEVVLATVVDAGGSVPRGPGTRLLARAGGELEGTIGGGALERRVLEAAGVLLDSRDDTQLLKLPLGAATGQCCGGVVSVFLEVMGRGPRLAIFGAGHVGRALASTLAGSAYRVEVIDSREEWAAKVATPARAVREDWELFLSRIGARAADYRFAVMTHQHDLDQAIIERLLETPARWIGLIGSRAKWERFRARLSAKGFSEAELARVRCPMGIDLGPGKSPKEIAISVAAELLADHYRDGGYPSGGEGEDPRCARTERLVGG